MRTFQTGRHAGWKSSPCAVMGIAAAVAIVFWIHSRQPLYHTDLWGHLAYGRLIWQTGAIPETEPFMPLARGVTLVDTAWLARRRLSRDFARRPAGHSDAARPVDRSLLCRPGSLAVCSNNERRLHSRRDGAVRGAQLVSISSRPAADGRLGLLCRAADSAHGPPRWRPVYWLAIPVTLALWASLHGSFVIGLGFLGTACLGRIIDVFRRTGHIMAPDPRSSFAAALIRCSAGRRCGAVEPLWSETVCRSACLFRAHPNLDRLLEWQALSLRRRAGADCGGRGGGGWSSSFHSAVAGSRQGRCWRCWGWAWRHSGRHGRSCGGRLWPRELPRAERARRVARPVAAWSKSGSPTSHLSGLMEGRRGGPGSSRVCDDAIRVAALCGPRRGPAKQRLRSRPQSRRRTGWLAHPSTGQLFNTYEWGKAIFSSGPGRQEPACIRDVPGASVPQVKVSGGLRDGDFRGCGLGTDSPSAYQRPNDVVVDKFKRGALIAMGCVN